MSTSPFRDPGDVDVRAARLGILLELDLGTIPPTIAGRFLSLAEAMLVESATAADWQLLHDLSTLDRPSDG